MFEIDGYDPSVSCIDCGKADKECVVAKCKKGTFHGPVCARCLFKEARKRSSVNKTDLAVVTNATKNETAKAPNGPPAAIPAKV